MPKVTFSVDEDTVQTLRRAAERTGKSQSAVVREAVAQYEARADRLTEDERRRMVALMKRVMARPPDRTQAEVDAELREIRRARRHGGRRTRAE